MRLLVDINHPKQVHTFRNAIQMWQERGHEVVITARSKDVVTQLLLAYGFDYHPTTIAHTGPAGLLWELLKHDWCVLRVAQEQQCDVLVGTSVAVSHVSRVVSAPSIVFNDDDMQAVRAFAYLAYPFASAIVTPDVLPDSLGRKHIRYRGYQELAYLHPNRFSPDLAVLQELGVAPDEPYCILRFVAFHAAHDMGETGLCIEIKRQLVRELSKRLRVFISSEAPLPREFSQYQIGLQPHRMHDALSQAEIFIGDSQTMTAEAAVLGIPAFRCNTFVGRISYLEDLERTYGLARGFRPEEEYCMLEEILRLLDEGGLKAEWAARRSKMLSEKIDLTPWMVEFVENFPESLHLYQEQVHGSAWKPIA